MSDLRRDYGRDYLGVANDVRVRGGWGWVALNFGFRDQRGNVVFLLELVSHC